VSDAAGADRGIQGVAAAFGPGSLPEEIIATLQRLVAAGIAPPP
jgi:L-asparaginase/Glu-tRNA(Gln) amidotransferase subunit D